MSKRVGESKHLNVRMIVDDDGDVSVEGLGPDGRWRVLVWREVGPVIPPCNADTQQALRNPVGGCDPD